MTHTLVTWGFVVALLAGVGTTEPGVFWKLLNPQVSTLERKLHAAKAELRRLGEPVLGQTVDACGYQHHRLDYVPVTPPWIQIDLGHEVVIDWIALFPVQLNWQSYDRASYGFPRRFRIDLSNDPAFSTPVSVADLSERDFPDPSATPVSFRVAGATARYVRLTVTKLAIDNGKHYFALAEMLVLAGPRNVAVNRPVTTSDPYELLPRWSPGFITDGRTPYGPPILQEETANDGLFCGVDDNQTPPMMQIDLGRPLELEEVRLHPVHGRTGADVPGYGFPRAFRIESSLSEGFQAPAAIFEASDLPNPGNNPVCFAAEGRARFVRVTFLPPYVTDQKRYGVSEIQVYSGGVNAARGATATATPDTSAAGRGRPPAMLTDGMTSFGRLMEWPEWLAMWCRRKELIDETRSLSDVLELANQEAGRRALLIAAVTVFAAGTGVVTITVISRRRRLAQVAELRHRLARDFHDEIGSNLATIAMLSEMAGGDSPDSTARADWRQVESLARETIHALRQTLWLIGARRDPGMELLEQLRSVTQRMLPRHEIIWNDPLGISTTGWPGDYCRNVFLLVKEALANILRHASATRVELTFQMNASQFEIAIRDDGKGFDKSAGPEGIGIEGMKERARDLRGRLEITTSPQCGTLISLKAPLPAMEQGRGLA